MQSITAYKVVQYSNAQGLNVMLIYTDAYPYFNMSGVPILAWKSSENGPELKMSLAGDGYRYTQGELFDGQFSLRGLPGFRNDVGV